MRVNLSSGTACWYWVNLLRHTSFSVVASPQRTTTYASGWLLPRASSGSQLDPVPAPKLTHYSTAGELLAEAYSPTWDFCPSWQRTQVVTRGSGSAVVVVSSAS